MDELKAVIVQRFRDGRTWANRHRVAAAGIALASLLFLQYLFLPNNSLQSLRKQNPKRTAMMEQRIEEAEEAGKPFAIAQQWVPLSRISRHLVNAVIVSEDGTFYEHEGVDWYELEESIRKNLAKGKAARGGSTISQQLAKNLFLSTSKDPVRKFKELVITLRMERTLSKRRILELYLNLIEWGDGVFGAEAAAKRYFGKSAANLTREEAARMAAVIPSPRRHRPDAASRYVLRRTSVILERMSARGY
ncbi:MAG: monofunctional biosynthetic peptidoglycan transglycosylase [Bacteroidetes bacterium]|nr:MAG: monofunctional biosynthetic peptidoglycan transglycosylase [Bacteroidota bacterium]